MAASLTVATKATKKAATVLNNAIKQIAANPEAPLSARQRKKLKKAYNRAAKETSQSFNKVTFSLTERTQWN